MMKILYRSLVILIDFFYITYTFSNEVVLQDIKFNPTAIIKELIAVFNILSAKKQSKQNENADLNITDLIVKYGYPVEEHHVETDDGYILTMVRIVKKGPVVFLMHGLLMSADVWVTAGPDDGLAYLLATAGYDVWMGNARGNKLSRQHVSISPEDPKFWNFSWDEIGRKDLPAMIDYVLNITGKDKLAYVGHSQGTTTYFVMCSEKPNYNEKISTMIALAPVAWTSYIKSPFARMAAPFNYYEMIILKLFQIYEILPNSDKFKYLVTLLCDIGNGIVCTTFLFVFCGFDYEQLNGTNIPIIFGHMPSGASVKQFIHYLQNIESGLFRKFDYGEDKNLELYGSTKPPEYTVENIKTPVALFYSDNDWFSDVRDVTTLKNTLPNVTEFYRVPFKKFNHIDYLWAKDVKRLVYAKILELLRFETKALKTTQCT